MIQREVTKLVAQHYSTVEREDQITKDTNCECKQPEFIATKTFNEIF